MRQSRKLLCISPVPTHPNIAGNRSRILNLLESVNNVDVMFVYLFEPRLFQTVDHGAMREQWGKNYRLVQYQSPLLDGTQSQKQFPITNSEVNQADDWYDLALDQSMGAILDEFSPDVVMLEYAYFSRILAGARRRRIRTIVDTHDVFAQRNQKFSKVNIQYRGELPEFVDEREEMFHVSRADAVIAISEDDASYFRMIGHPLVRCVGHIAATQVVDISRRNSTELIFISGGSKVGVDGISRFLQEVFPIIKAKQPLVQLNIVGPIGELLGDVPSGVRLTGSVRDLTPFFSSAAIAINYDQFATGLSIKNMTALANSIPCVTTSMGARGNNLILDESSPLIVRNDPRSFADAVIDLMRNHSRRNQLSRRALECSQEMNKRYVGTFAELISSAI